MNTNIKISLLILAALLINAFSANANADDNNKTRTAILNISFGPEAKGVISEEKVEAAFNLVNLISEKYEYKDLATRDSIIAMLKKNNTELNIQNISQSLNVDKLFAIHIDRLANMIRVNMLSINAKDSTKSDGNGYALASYFTVENNAALYDPALLKAMQRAFAVTDGDSLLFTKNDTAFYAYPTPTLVISGLKFIDDAKLPKWEVFNMKEVNSYLIVESIFDTLRFKNNLTLYDQISRDSIYAIFGLKIPENHNSVSEAELSCLAKFEVDYVLSGSFSRIDSGARLILTLFRLKDNKLSLIHRVESELLEDSKLQLGQLARKTAIRLIEEQEGKTLFKGGR